jgi:ABC-type glycerol-3-phosphate transport system substrate-binding protein
MRRSGGLGAAFVVSATLLAGCGGGGGSATPSTATTPSTAPTRTHSTTAPSSQGNGALAAEANSAAAGDIPDNQVFLVFSNRSEGYSIKYPRAGRSAGPAPL